jgi:hypothetical protein
VETFVDTRASASNAHDLEAVVAHFNWMCYDHQDYRLGAQVDIGGESSWHDPRVIVGMA